MNNTDRARQIADATTEDDFNAIIASVGLTQLSGEISIYPTMLGICQATIRQLLGDLDEMSASRDLAQMVIDSNESYDRYAVADNGL